MSRIDELIRFYDLLGRLEMIVGGARTLADLSDYRDWPERGVYLFFEPSEVRREILGLDHRLSARTKSPRPPARRSMVLDRPLDSPLALLAELFDPLATDRVGTGGQRDARVAGCCLRSG